MTGFRNHHETDTNDGQRSGCAQISNLFKSVTGLTFREFLTRRRIVRAIDLLRDQDRSLTDVYLDVGFKDLSHFSRVFRKVTGQSPSRFRRIREDRAG